MIQVKTVVASGEVIRLRVARGIAIVAVVAFLGEVHRAATDLRYQRLAHRAGGQHP